MSDTTSETIVHPAGGIVDLASELPSRLPRGWRMIDVPGVERPVVVGPAGVFVLVPRHPSSMPIGLDDPSPWPDRRGRMSTPQVTAELASQLLAARTGIQVRVRPVAVIDTVDTLVLDRPDRVHVVHRDHLHWWLSGLPDALGAGEIARIVRCAHPVFDPPAA